MAPILDLQYKGIMADLLPLSQREPKIQYFKRMLCKNLFATFPDGDRIPSDDQFASAPLSRKRSSSCGNGFLSATFRCFASYKINQYLKTNHCKTLQTPAADATDWHFVNVKAHCTAPSSQFTEGQNCQLLTH